MLQSHVMFISTYFNQSKKKIYIRKKKIYSKFKDNNYFKKFPLRNKFALMPSYPAIKKKLNEQTPLKKKNKSNNNITFLLHFSFQQFTELKRDERETFLYSFLLSKK